MKLIDRSFVISTLAGICILSVGRFLFRHSEAGMAVTIIATFVVASTVRVQLDMRSGRLERRRR
jgi:hypothetical protein